ncbi:MAG: hypothetical protein JXR22_05445 [Prolixibacteraceae bacterium]|nr:hypothetical protein [Prolixibacteraceae bacterium]
MSGLKIGLHQAIAFFYTLVVFATFFMILFWGYGYYATVIEERYFHVLNSTFKASGFYGHGFGIIGSFFIVFGVFSYMLRKRIRRFSRIGTLRNWLLFHIFLCVEGSVLILFHTTFKFGGIVAVSFWSMVAVLLSGVIGRYIYLQIPRTIEGREMNLLELDDMKFEMNKKIRSTVNLDESIYDLLTGRVEMKVNFFSFLWKSKLERNALKMLKKQLKEQNIRGSEFKNVLDLFKKQISLKKRITTLNTMQNLFKYWHVAHLPFALVMLVIMVVHVGVAVTFGYKWIF